MTNDTKENMEAGTDYTQAGALGLLFSALMEMKAWMEWAESTL